MQSKTKGRKTFFSFIRGFSILEVVAALVVLAILVAIYFPKQKGMQDSANMVKAQSELKTIEAALETYKNNNQTYPPTTDKLVEEYLIPEVPHMLPEVLHDPFADSGTEYTYTASPDGQYYAVSSVGPDRSQAVSPVSDGGEVRSQGNSLVVSNGRVVQTDSTGAAVCSVGQTKCAGVCVNLKTSATHCGMCGVACSGTTNQCVNGSCQCGDNPACSGTTDTCSSGTCKCGSEDACETGEVCSAGSCFAVLSDDDNCGSVGTVCANGKTCQEGVCACVSGDFNDDDNCGTCGSACTGVSDTCTSGVCTCGVNAACGANEACVGSICVDLLTDEDNCGSVGTLCVGSRECTAGVCVCTAGLTECSDSCVDTQTSSTHCGACDTACAEGEMCITGTCTAVYTVTYNGNGNTGGSVPSDNGSYAEDNEVTVLGNTGVLEKDGYTFDGWNTSEDGTGVNYESGETFTMGSGDVILHANWDAETSTLPPLCESYIHTIDIGSPASEAAYALEGWSTNIWPAAGGVWGGGDDGTIRTTWFSGDEPWARVTVTPQINGRFASVQIRHLDGPSNDSFTVLANEVQVGQYTDQTSVETWYANAYSLADIDGPLTLTITATGAQWGDFNTYGQLGVSWIKVIEECL